MRVSRTVASAMLASTILAGSARADVAVTFVNPARFHDEDFRGTAKRNGILDEFRRYLVRLGDQYLGKGQRLGIEVLDIRLAGQYEPWRPHWNDVRILTDITPPRFRLRYTLRQGGKVVVSAEESVTDINYLWRASARFSSERFAYEKDMLRDWFRKRFVRLVPPPARR